MLKQRVIFGFLGAVLAVMVLTLCPAYIIGICIGIIELIALYEFFSVTGLKEKKTPAVWIGVLFSVVSTVFVILKSEKSLDLIYPSILGFTFILMLMMVFFHSRCKFSDCATIFLGTIYITLFFLHIQMIRQMDYGKILVWVLFISAWATDTFASFSGLTLGKHKLCPTISPKKTIEGSVGGIIGCIICVELYVWIISSVNNIGFSWINAGICAIIASFISQIGDLAASCIKREHGAKDYGNLIPGHGGVMDRFDSVLFIAPVVYYLIKYLPIF